jgi:hypothetical protein
MGIAVEGQNQLFVGNDLGWNVDSGAADGDTMHKGCPEKVRGGDAPSSLGLSAELSPGLPLSGRTIHVVSINPFCLKDDCHGQ